MLFNCSTKFHHVVSIYPLNHMNGLLMIEFHSSVLNNGKVEDHKLYFLPEFIYFTKKR